MQIIPLPEAPSVDEAIDRDPYLTTDNRLALRTTLALLRAAESAPIDEQASYTFAGGRVAIVVGPHRTANGATATLLRIVVDDETTAEHEIEPAPLAVA